MCVCVKGERVSKRERESETGGEGESWTRRSQTRRSRYAKVEFRISEIKSEDREREREVERMR